LPFGLPLTPGLNLVASPAPEGPRKPVFDIVIILKSCFDFFDFLWFFRAERTGNKDFAAGTGEITKRIKRALGVFGMLADSGTRVFKHLRGAMAFDLFDSWARNRHSHGAIQTESK